jgi:hypothetical protein
MSDYNAIADVGSSLIKLLWDNISNDEAFKKNTGLKSETQITLSSPDNLDDRYILSIFLYQILEDTYQKNQDPIQIYPNRFRAPSLPLRLFYLIAPNSKDGLKDHILMGKVIEVFNDHRILRPPYLLGSVSGVELELIFSSLTIDDINKIWSVISKSKPYISSVYYEVARAKIDSKQEETFSRVFETHQGAL